MRITFLVPTAYDLGGTAGAVATQAAFLAPAHEVHVLSVHRDRDEPHFHLPAAVAVTDLVDLREGHERAGALTADQVRALRGRPTRLLPPGVDPHVDALADVGLEAVLPTLETDVLVTVTPALLAAAAALAPPGVALVHQEHRSSSQRAASRELLLDATRRADVVAMLVEPMAAWLRRELGSAAPEVVVLPNALPAAYRPRSPLTSPVVLAAGRLAAEKQYPELVSAFARIADRIPEWRLRIFGDGPHRFAIAGAVRRHGLWDRVELPGPTDDLASEWARASVSALSSSSEGYPLVVQEAMAAGVPVVAYDCPSGPREIITDGVDGLLVAPGSVDGLAAGLLRLTTDEAQRSRLGAAALETSRQWDPSTMATRWSEVYAAAVERRGRRGAGRTTSLHVAAAEAGGGTVPASPSPRSQDEAPPGCEGEGVTPAEARQAALSAVCGAASTATGTAAGAPGGVGGVWWVVPPHTHAAPQVVLPMSARRAFLEALATAAQRGAWPAYLSVHDPERAGWPSRRGTAEHLVTSLRRGRTSRLLVEPWPRSGGVASLIGEGCGVEVEFWEEGVDGDLHTPGGARYATRTSRTPSLVTTRVHELEVPTHPLMTQPTPPEVTFDVDAVWTWVDGSDPAWEVERRRRLHDLDDPAARERTRSGPSRYADRGELRWSMRSVHLLAPWVRRLHVVTAGQVPAWLDVDHPQVNLVDHRDILPAQALPTFNSHAIEAALHRIDGLAEHFCYLNDDMVLSSPRRREDFFTATGSTAVLPSSGVVGLPGQDRGLPYLQAAGVNRRLLEEAFGRVVVHTLAHAPYAHRRSRLAEIAARFPAEVAATERAPFRSPTDVSMLSSLAQHYGLMTGTAHLARGDWAYVDLADAGVGGRLRALLERDRDGFCLGESHDFARDPVQVQGILDDVLGRLLPVPAPWERDAPASS